MEVSVTEAKARLPELLRRAEAGEEVIFTRRGVAVARLTPEPRKRTMREMSREEFLAFVDDLAAKASAEALPGPCAARSQDFLYDDDGAPR